MHLQQSESLSNYGSVNSFDEGEVNVEGFWFRVNPRPSWSCTSPTYGTTQQDSVWHCTKISFTAKDLYTTSYYYEVTGDWTSEESGDDAITQAREQTEGRIPLRYVYTMDGEVTQTQRQFDYHAESGNVLTQRHSTIAYIIYSYSDASDPCATLKRIWAGSDPDDHYYPTDPCDGRWIDVEYDEHDMLTHISHGCGSCGGGERYYTYEQSHTNHVSFAPNYDPSDPCTWVLSGYLTGSIKAADGSTVLKSYKYDLQDRYTSYWLGAQGTGLRVTEWEYTDYNGNDKLIRRDYVDDTYYRARLYLAPQNQVLSKEYHYHNLQAGDTLSGPYSVISYTYSRDGSNQLTKATTQLPRGNKIYTLYYAAGGVSARQRGSYDGAPVTEARYTYNTKKRVIQQIDARNGTTNYDYNGTDQVVIRRTDPDPCRPLSDPGRQTTEYEYDQHGNLTMERQLKDSSDNWVTTAYAYDGYDNPTQQIADYSGSQLATTAYAYNEYNEQTLVADPQNNTRKMFYSLAGMMTAEVAYNGSGQALTEMQYIYDSDGWLVTKKVASATAPFTAGSPSSWIEELYKYDSYGRRTAVIVDAGGKNLTTGYYYNNQSELTKVVSPDLRYKATVRNGRGLMAQEITGVNGVDKATTLFYYDLNGNLTRKVDPEGVSEIYRYNEFDKLIYTRRGE